MESTHEYVPGVECVLWRIKYTADKPQTFISTGTTILLLSVLQDFGQKYLEGFDSGGAAWRAQHLLRMEWNDQGCLFCGRNECG